MSDIPLPQFKQKVKSLGEQSRNLTRITTIRIVVQAVCFTMFMLFVGLTTFANLDRFPGLKLWVSKILEIDPLVGLATSITTHTVYKGLLWSLLLLVPTLFLGRFFCNWMCPYGILHQFVGWAFNGRTKKQQIESNRYRKIYQTKYYILVALIVAAVLGSLQIGLLDPICLIYRSFTGAILPTMNMPSQSVFGDFKMHQGALVIGLLLFGLVAMNLVIPRFFCRVLCPLGAFLGVLSRFSWWRIERDPVTCTDCDLCLIDCEGASDPHAELRKSECFVCFNCIEQCPHKSLSFAFMPPKKHEVTGTSAPRRRLIFAGIAGLLFFPFARAAGRSTRNFSANAIRPPGAVEELEFLERCIKCDQCIRVCPTNVLQPAWFETGLEGLWTPIMNFRMGHCQLHCTACGHVCPTGAIQRLCVEEKLGIGEYADQGPIKLGTAHFDTGRCLPYSKNIPCVVCEEVCPTSPKAIYGQRLTRMVRDGQMVALAATADSVTVRHKPEPGQVSGEPALFAINRWQGDTTTRYFIDIRHADGMTETHRVAANDTDTLKIEGRFAREPATGSEVTMNLEFKVPKIDTELCIGCGICERECPVVGDRRAVYVTAEGETRSEAYQERDRNRSLRLMKTASADDAGGNGNGRRHQINVERSGAKLAAPAQTASTAGKGPSPAVKIAPIGGSGEEIDLVQLARDRLNERFLG